MSTQNQRAVRELAKIAGQYGFRFERTTRGGHLRWRGPKGIIMITAATPSDQRWLKRCKTTMRTLIRQGETQ